MNSLSLALHALLSRKLASLLSVLLTAFGVMMALAVLQFSAATQQRIASDGAGIDIVIGAKGSPLQLVLSSVYHADIPAGNIPYAEAQKWMHHPQVKQAIPLALGDNWRGLRIVGTTPDYAAHYGAEIAEGRLWQKPFEAVAGARTGLALGQTFSGAHGLTAGGHDHGHQPYEITGILKPTGSVIDRLILTSLDSVLVLHGQETVQDSGDDHDDHEHHHDHADEPEKQAAEITAVLVKTRSPLANINLPRSINRESMLQAATPALEMARLSAVFGIGTRSLGYISAFLVGMAALSIFAGMAGSLEGRSGDLAVLRALGFSPLRLFGMTLAEGMMMVTAGLVLGFALGLGGFSLLAQKLPALDGATLRFHMHWVWLCLAVLAAGFAAALLPALRAARANPAQLLSQR